MTKCVIETKKTVSAVEENTDSLLVQAKEFAFEAHSW